VLFAPSHATANSQRDGDSNVSILWIVGGVGVIAAIVLAVFTARRGDREERDLGSVSNQWVSEHRLSGQTHDTHR
jgi:hypothetical protein